MKADLVTIEKGSNLTFPSHIHSSFELVMVNEGEILLTVGKNQYVLREGDSALIFPNQIHEFQTQKSSKHTLCIFSPQLVKAYAKVFENKIPICNKFNLDKFYQNKVLEISDKSSSVALKGILYSVCAEFDKKAEYESNISDKKNLLFTIFKFVEENFSGECSLHALAEKTSYNYVYLSKHFTRCTGISYTEYVNRYRINEACYLLTNTSRTMLDIAYECGFDCLRSFNRNFKKIMGITPTDYRQGI
jgi:YesN/AraC family two-component response regulator